MLFVVSFALRGAHCFLAFSLDSNLTVLGSSIQIFKVELVVFLTEGREGRMESWWAGLTTWAGASWPRPLGPRGALEGETDVQASKRSKRNGRKKGRPLEAAAGAKC